MWGQVPQWEVKKGTQRKSQTLLMAEKAIWEEFRHVILSLDEIVT